MGALLIRLGGWLVSTLFADNLLRFIAGKAILTTLFIIVVPILLNNFAYDLIDVAQTFINSNATSSGLNGSMSFTGLAAYIVLQTKVPECLSVLVSAMVLRVVLNHVPFLRV